jgi:hypothetical protein
MDELIFQLDENDHLMIAIIGLLVSILIWKWTIERFPDYFADQVRLFISAFLTAGIASPGGYGYVLFSIVMVLDLIRPLGFEYLYLYCAFLIIVYWVIYSILVYWIRWVCRSRI